MVIGACSLAFSGCGGGPVDEKIPVAVSAIEASAKRTLEEFEKTGKLGSGLTGLESDINGIKTSNPAKAEDLMNSFRELQGLQDAAKIKAKAKEMIGKL
jgi:hypothetical protein